MIVVKVDGMPYLCKTDEVGELCVCSGYTGVGYWGLDGITVNTFQVCNVLLDNHEYMYFSLTPLNSYLYEYNIWLD